MERYGEGEYVEQAAPVSDFNKVIVNVKTQAGSEQSLPSLAGRLISLRTDNVKGITTLAATLEI